MKCSCSCALSSFIDSGRQRTAVHLGSSRSGFTSFVYEVHVDNEQEWRKRTPLSHSRCYFKQLVSLLGVQIEDSFFRIRLWCCLKLTFDVVLLYHSLQFLLLYHSPQFYTLSKAYFLQCSTKTKFKSLLFLMIFSEPDINVGAVDKSAAIRLSCYWLGLYSVYL